MAQPGRDASKVSSELARLNSAQRGNVHQFAGGGASKLQEQVLKLSRRAVKALSGVNILDLNKSGASPAHSVDGVHAEPAIADEP